MQIPGISPILDRIRELDPAVQRLTVRPVSGGCIHRSFHLQGQRQHRPWQRFLKISDASASQSLEAESRGLHTLRQALAARPDNPLRVPQPFLTDKVNGVAFLLMEYLPLTDSNHTDDEKKLGQGLVLLHQSLQADGRFGLAHDNFIGATPQKNTWNDDWVAFFRECRLKPQQALAAKNGYLPVARQIDKLIDKLPDYFTGHAPKASLLHGDLWAGNAGFLADGSPAIFDPAVYYGDREADLAMMEMFGGFSPLFFAAYRLYAKRAGHPLPAADDPEFLRRKRIYQLYHWLNHLNLFGSIYLPQVQHCLSEIDSLRK